MKEDAQNQSLVVIIDSVIDEIVEFEPLVPLAVNLRVNGMMPRHWEAIIKALDISVPYNDKGFNLSKCISLNLQEHMGVIEDISNKAAKE